MTYGQGFGYGYAQTSTSTGGAAGAGAALEAQQCPVPCVRCGAAMAPVAGVTGYADAVPMRCAYCGAQEVLANESRVRVARERIAQLRAAQDAAEAPARGVDQLIKRRPWLGGLLVGGVMMLNGLGSVRTTVASITASQGMDAEEQWRALAQVCALPAAGIGVAAGMMLGWYAALKRYRALVEPDSWARPPTAPDGAARCRCCGGELPARWGAFVECAFCRTPNMLDRALLARRDALLRDETLQHQQRAAGVIARANQFTPNFGRYSLIGAAAGGVLFGALGVAFAALMVA